jgi:hypothetical protein
MLHLIYNNVNHYLANVSPHQDEPSGEWNFVGKNGKLVKEKPAVAKVPVVHSILEYRVGQS